MIERTLSLIKPDCVGAKNAGKVIDILEKKGFSIIGMKKVKLSKKDAEGFYAVHKDRPFFESLTDFMSKGPIVAMVLEKENAIADYRALMGETNSKEAKEGTLRAQFGTDIERNAVHGSDAVDTADFEIGYFFNELELVTI